MEYRKHRRHSDADGWLLAAASLNLPAKNQADNIKQALGGQYPQNGYEFYDKHFVLLAQNQDVVNYSKLTRLIEDESYCYLCLNEQAGYMVDKLSLGDDLAKFMPFMEKATGLKWVKPYKLSTFNLKAILRLMGGSDGRKSKKKSKKEQAKQILLRIEQDLFFDYYRELS